MSSVLLDNDIVLKVSRFSLVNEFLSVCTVPSSTYILPTLKYVFRLNSEDQAIQRVGSKASLKAMRDFIASVDELAESPPLEILSHFQDVFDIDTGEAVLFATTAVWDKSVTITGDKRCLTALASLCVKAGLIETFSGRLKCLEQTVAEMMLSEFSANVASKIQGQDWDKALRICFNSGDKNNTLECLSSYYRHLNATCHGMLAPFPDF